MSDAPDLACRELAEVAWRHLDGLDSPVERERVELHLLVCDGCAAHVENLRATLDLLRRARAGPLAGRAPRPGGSMSASEGDGPPAGCAAAWALLPAALDGTLTSAERAWLGAHCPDCAVPLAELRAALARLDPAASAPVAPETRERLLALFRARRAGRPASGAAGAGSP